MTTSILRLKIVVTKFFETAEYIAIKYFFDGKEKNLCVHKDIHLDLMEWVGDEPASQWDCINIVVAHEGNVRKQVQHIDMGRVQEELRSN